MPTEEPDIKEMEEDNEIDEDDIEFDGGMRVPREMYDNLFEYQKTGKLLFICLASVYI